MFGNYQGFAGVNLAEQHRRTALAETAQAEGVAAVAAPLAQSDNGPNECSPAMSAMAASVEQLDGFFERWESNLSNYYGDAARANRVVSRVRQWFDNQTQEPLEVEPVRRGLWAATEALPVRRIGETRTAHVLIEPTRPDTEPITPGPYWAWVCVMDTVRVATVDNPGHKPTCAGEAFYRPLGQQFATHRGGHFVNFQLGGYVQALCRQWQDYAAEWCADASPEDIREHLECWAESARLWAMVNSPSSCDGAPQASGLPVFMANGFDEESGALSWYVGASLNADDEEWGDWYWVCDGCDYQVTQCECSYDVDVTQSVSGTAYASTMVPRRNAEGVAINEDMLDDQIDSGSLSWDGPEDWEEDYSERMVDDVTPSW